jgi:hypothetical protein
MVPSHPIGEVAKFISVGKPRTLVVAWQHVESLSAGLNQLVHISYI